MIDDYEDIINLSHWEPQYHRRMAVENRAAQFAPFAALTGHDAAIKETARRNDERYNALDNHDYSRDPDK